MSYRHNTPISHHVSSQVVTGQHVYKVIQEAKIKNVQNRGDLGWLGLPKVIGNVTIQ